MNDDLPTLADIDPSGEARYLVVFQATLTDDNDGYAQASAYLNGEVGKLPGYLGQQSFRDGAVTTSITYWRDLESIRQWRAHPDHQRIQKEARRRWYSGYSVNVCAIERAYRHPI